MGHGEEVIRMAKAYCYCTKCKKILTQVLSSFECLATWNTVEDFYEPGDECKLVYRCPDCGILTIERKRRIKQHELKKKTGKENVNPAQLKKKLTKEMHQAI